LEGLGSEMENGKPVYVQHKKGCPMLLFEFVKARCTCNDVQVINSNYKVQSNKRFTPKKAKVSNG
jgi:hypothetical protein